MIRIVPFVLLLTTLLAVAEGFVFTSIDTQSSAEKHNLTFTPITEYQNATLVLTGYSVTDRTGNELQVIPHDLSAIYERQPISLIDFNFDGHLDVMLFDGGSSVPNMFYAFWRYSPTKRRFELDERLADISSIDEDRELLFSYGRSGPEKSWATYRWANDKLILVEKFTVHRDPDEGLTATLSIYEDGILRKRITGPDWTSKVEWPHDVIVERFDTTGKLKLKAVETRHRRNG